MAVIIAACASETGSSNNSQSNTVAAEIDGKRIWKIRCLSCHGYHGNQELNGAANLQEVNISLEERIQVITNGKQGKKGIMTAFGGILSPEEIEAVAKHSMTFNKNL